MVISFVLSFFPRGVLDEIVNLIGSVSEGFPPYSIEYWGGGGGGARFRIFWGGQGVPNSQQVHDVVTMWVDYWGGGGGGGAGQRVCLPPSHIIGGAWSLSPPSSSYA